MKPATCGEHNSGCLVHVDEYLVIGMAQRAKPETSLLGIKHKRPFAIFGTGLFDIVPRKDEGALPERNLERIARKWAECHPFYGPFTCQAVNGRLAECFVPIDKCFAAYDGQKHDKKPKMGLVMN